MSELLDVCPVDELPAGQRRTVEWEGTEIGVFNCDGEFLAIEDVCTHLEPRSEVVHGSLGDGPLDTTACTVECPRHGALFDLRTGAALTLPAYMPVETFPVLVEDGQIKIEVE